MVIYANVGKKKKVHKTRRYERHRIRSPKQFKKGSFRTHDIGRKGYSKRIAGRLKSNDKWATQSLLVSHKESPKMKRELRQKAEYMRKRR